LPSANVIGQQRIDNTNGDHNTPSIASDPLNPAIMAVAFTRNDPTFTGDPVQKVLVESQISLDGGQTWSAVTVPLNLIDPTSTAIPPNRLPQATDTNIAFDRQHNFYIVYSEHSTNQDVGAIILQKYHVNPSTGVVTRTITDKMLRTWASQGVDGDGIGFEAALNPTLTIDTSNPLFGDPITGGFQRDDSSGTIYVAWNNNNRIYHNGNPAFFNPNSIEVMASFDGAADFTSANYLNVNTYNVSPAVNPGEKDSFPKLVTSQGTASNRPAQFGSVAGGQLTAVWNNFGQGMGRTLASRVNQGGGAGAEYVSGPFPSGVTHFAGMADMPFTMGNYKDAIDPGAGGNHIPADNELDFNVDLVNGYPGFANDPLISGLNVTLNIDNNHLDTHEIYLINPQGTRIPLIRNHIGANGMAIMGQGFTAGGTGLGVLNGIPFDTVFDNLSPRNILDMDAVAPYIAHFQPEIGALPSNFRASTATGTWQLHIVVYRHNGDMPPNFHQRIFNWKLTFTEALTPSGPEGIVASNAVKGAKYAGLYPLKPNFYPDRGVGPTPSLASDNTLGTYSPFQGRIYMAYTIPPPTGSTDNFDVVLTYSDDGARTWSFPSIVNDDTSLDGFSEGNRAQFQPEVAVDQFTGTVAYTYYDGRYDAARLRVVTTLATSIDGGQTFQNFTQGTGKQVYLNPSQTAIDAVTQKNINVQPVPDNESTGNANRDQSFGFGDHQGLVIAAGRVTAVWSSNQNTRGATAATKLGIEAAIAQVPAGPRIISSTMGPLTSASATQLSDLTPLPYNSTYSPDGVQQIDGFIITFDRLVNPGSVTPNVITLVFHDTVTPQGTLGTVIPVLSVTPIFDTQTTSSFSLQQQQFFGASEFLVRFQPQNRTGTYSYAVGPTPPNPGPQDRIRSPIDASVFGNLMDQNNDGIVGEFPTNSSGGDSYAVPAPLNNGRDFQAPYDKLTLPIIIPGPHIIGTFVNGSPASPDNLVLNRENSSLDIVFDRDMDPSTVNASAVLRMVGPVGPINGFITVAADPNPNFSRMINGSATSGPDPNPSFPRTYKISFPSQKVSGTYTITLAPTVRAKNGDLLDTNLNAGVDVLRDTPSLGTTQGFTYPNTTGITLPPNTTSTSTIFVPDAFVIQGITLSLNISSGDVRDLSAALVAPDGTQIQLFTFVGGSNPPFNLGFQNTVFDDNASDANGNPNPIQGGRSPFNGTFTPQQPLTVLVGKAVSGTYRLNIFNKSTTRTDTLNQWSLTFQKAIPRSGLGDPVADQANVSFRIFTEDKSNPLSKKEWTAVGPASINANTNSSRIAGIAVDPSDPSGNTVFVAGASGGVWKSSNFLTTDLRGPTYVPLTDTAPTFGLNIGSIAVFGRNNDPKQSIVFIATGEGDTGSPGVGVLRSMDGGNTWTLLDSSDNTLPFSLRDHRFAGTTAFKILVNPTPGPGGSVIAYLAVSGTNGGIYRTVDGGDHWTLQRAGQATDVVFANASADPVNGVLRILYAGFKGEGIFLSPNEGDRWNLLTGGAGVLWRNGLGLPNFVQVTNSNLTPGMGQGRIVLATPALIPSSEPNARVENLLYQGWLYAYVSKTDNHSDGLYVTKDFGQNWTKVHATVIKTNGLPTAITNDDTKDDYDILGTNAPQGNYDIALSVDPNNPNVVYVGGTKDTNELYGGLGALIRVDTTGMSDARSLLAFNNFRNDGGKAEPDTIGGVTLDPPVTMNVENPYGLIDQNFGVLENQPHVLNLIDDPFQPFLINATQIVANFGPLPAQITTLNNTGIQVKWIVFGNAIRGSNSIVPSASPTTDLHRMVSMLDPLTGRTRLIVGDDQGIFSVVDPGDGTTNFIKGIGSASSPTDPSRNGNLQITQFYGGASQPSLLAAQIAGAMFYGEAQDNGFPLSDPNVLTNGNIGWTGPEGDGQWVGTDQTGRGDVYEYRWPCCGGDTSNFFVANRTTGRTQGLIVNPPDTANWPTTGGFNAAINPVSPDGQQIVISSLTGKIFRTSTGGFQWFQIAAPADTGNSGNAQALAYGAPDPADPTHQTDNFIYAGTVGMGTSTPKIYVTFDGGGHWKNISAGLDGSPIQAIVTNPNRGSHEAYAVTALRVYFMADSSAANPVWVDITSNLTTITHDPFGNADYRETQLKSITSLVADWRFSYLDDPGNPQGPTHPVLYVGGYGGVYRSLDKGQTWTIFPDIGHDGAPADGGYLPNTQVTHLDLAIGNINPNTGFPVRSTSPDILLASTYGRGSFAIRIPAPNNVQETFVIGLDNRVWGQKLDANGRPAGNYFLTSQSVVKSITTGSDSQGRPLVFAIGLDNQVYIQKFDVNGNPNGDYGLTAPGAIKADTLGKDPASNAQLFVIGLDDQVYSLHFDFNSNPVGSYFFVAPGAVKTINVTQDASNRPELFVTGLDNQIWARRFDANGNPLASESYFLTRAGAVKSIATGQDANGRPEIFVIGLDNQVYYQQFTADGLSASAYSPVVPLARQVKSITFAHDANFNPLLFVTGLDDQVYMKTFDANGAPAGFDYIFTAPGQIKTYTVSFDGANNPEVFAIGLDDQVYYQLFDTSPRSLGFYLLMNPGQVKSLVTTH
jgi:subtilisin-like proprotein convertase family protein